MGEMPSGTVTLLFTDIESSSGLWETDPAAMSEALSTHDRIVSDAIGVEGGVVFKHLGDGMCAAFESAPQAVAAAVAAQRGLGDQRWDGVANCARERNGNRCSFSMLPSR